VKVVAFSSNRSKKLANSLGPRNDVEIISARSNRNILAQHISLLRDGHAFVTSEQPQTILVNQDGVTAFVAAILALLYGKPLVVRLGGDPWRVHREKLVRSIQTVSPLHLLLRGLIISINAITFRIAAGFIVVSEDLGQRVRAVTGRSSTDIRVVHTSLDVSEFDTPTARSKVDYGITEDIVLLTVTNLQFRGKYKGVHDLLTPIDRVLSKHENACYVIAGEGQYHEELRERVDKVLSSDVRERVYMVGYVDNIRSLYANSDIFLYMSHIDGYPNVVLEAKAVALPIITNPQFGMIEQIDNGESGYLISAVDTDEIEHRVTRLVTSPEERSRLGKTAKAEVKRENNPAKKGQELIDAICELC